MMKLARSVAALFAFLLPLQAQALDFSDSRYPKAPGPDYFSQRVRKLQLPDADEGSTGDLSGMSVRNALLPRGAPYKFAQILNRRLHAIDFCTLAERVDITAYTGALDARPCLQAAFTAAQAQGKGLLQDAGFWNLKTGSVTAGMGLQVEGEGWGELPIFDGEGAVASPNHGTVTNFDYLASVDPYGFKVVGSGVSIRNMEFRQTQPTPAPGWTPRVGPWAIYAYAVPFNSDGGHRLTVEHVMLRNVYDGINLGITRGGLLHDIYGQPFHRGIRIEANVDEPHISGIHLGWPYWSGQADVMASVHGNLVALDLLRVDNPKLSNIFTFNAFVGLRCSQRTDSYNPGNCARLIGTNIEHDAVAIGTLLEDGAAVSLTNYSCYADSTFAGSTCLTNPQKVGTDYYQGARISLANADLQGSNGPAIQLGFSPLYNRPTHQFSNVRIRSFDAANSGTQAIVAAPGVTVQKSNLLVEGVTDPSRIFGGGGRMIIPGNGVIGSAGWTELTNGMILQWGKNAGNATVTFQKACPTNVVSVVATQEASPATNAAETVSVNSVGLTGFTAASRFITGNTTPGGEAFYWQALCY